MASLFAPQKIQGLDVTSFAQNYARRLAPKGIRFAGLGASVKPLTPSQEELLPYLQKEAEKQAKKKGLLQPVEALFNLLNRGQFLTAGIAQRILKNIEQDRPALENMPQTIKEAVTGKVQYDWEVVLFGGKHKGGEKYAGVVPWEPTTGAGKFGKGAAGFLANVLLDPLTYVGFGPARAAKVAATQYSKDAVKYFMKGISKEAKEALPEMIQKGFSKEVFTKKWGESVPGALKYMEKYAGGDITRFYSKIQKQAYKEALRKTSKELTEPLLKGFEKDLAEKGIAKGAKRLSKKRIKALTGEEDYLKKLIADLKKDPYAGAGTRAGRFMRAEFAVGERYPDWLKTMDKLKKRMGESKIGGTFSDAWWRLMNNPKSPVAALRKMFHVRNPYQKLVSIMERDLVEQSSYSMVAKGHRIGGIVDDLTDKEYTAVRDFMIKSQIMQEQAQRGAETIPIRAAELVQKYGKDINIDKVSKRIDELNRLTKEWWDFDKAAFEKGLVPKTGMWRDYLPEQRIGTGKKGATQMGAAAQTFTKERKVGWSGNIKSQVEKIKWMYGMDEEMAYKTLMGGGGELNIDLKDMLIRRALAQTRLEQRVNMIEKIGRAHV